MTRFLCFFICFLFTATVHAGCPNEPMKDFGREAQTKITSKRYTYLGTVQNRCWYFRDVVFKNEHGEQAVVVASSHGECIGFFRTSLAEEATLLQAKLSIRRAQGNVVTVDISTGIPKVISFDGDTSDFEKCIN